MHPVCPACESEIEIDELDVDKGDVIGCPECGVDLLVWNVAPIELKLAIDEGGEWNEL
ncbi:MAG: lysine biosynthesis protein LysW [Acidobacteriota bacterium]